MGMIALCCDTESLIRPMLIGLEGVNLDSLDWLISIPDAVEARKAVKARSDIGEVWIVSSDQLESTNLAAALRKDDAAIEIDLIAFEKNASLLARCSQIGVSNVWDVEEFCRHFDAEKRRRFLMGEVKSLEISDIAAIQKDPPAKSKPLPRIKQPIENTGQNTELSIQRKSDNCFLISVLSGSGGVGKSSIAVLLSAFAKSHGLKTAVIDADAQFGDLSRMTGKGSGIQLDEAIENPAALLAAISSVNPGENAQDAHEPFLVSAPSRMEKSEVVMGRLGEAVTACSKCFDAVIVDTPANWSDDHAWILENSDVSIFVMDQKSSSIHSIRHAVDLCMRMGIATSSFVFALNRCRKDAIFGVIEVSNAIDGAAVVELRDGGQEVEECLSAGNAWELIDSKNEFATSVRDMFTELLPVRNYFERGPEWKMPADEDPASAKSESGAFFFNPERRKRRRQERSRSADRNEMRASKKARVKNHVAD